MDKNLFELYSDYLLSSYDATTATGLSRLVDGEISHDKVTRFLSSADFDSRLLWQQVKSVAREIEQDDGVLIIDDTILEKPYTDENDVVCWHFDHTKNRNVKGVNLLNCVYHSGDTSIPVAFEVVKKPIKFCDLKTRAIKRKSETTKNQQAREMLGVCHQNNLKFQYVLVDSWFSSKENMTYIHRKLKKHFVVALKSNRLVALSEEDKREGRFVRIDQMAWPEQAPVQAWIKGLEFPVLLSRQVFTNKDGSTGVLYLACSDLHCDEAAIETIYKKRWKVEVFHKTLKSNTGLGRSPTRRVRTQQNHVFMSIYAAFQLERLSIQHSMNHFALRSKIYMKAIRSAFEELRELKACVT